MTKKEIDKLLEKSECIQKEFHSMVTNVRKTERGKKIPYKDLLAVFFFMKLAELQNKIENQVITTQN